MRRVIVGMSTVLVLGCTKPGAGQGPEVSSTDAHADEETILREIDGFTEAWSQGDAAAAASFYTADGVRVGASGDVQHGRAEIEAAYDGLIHGPLQGATLSQERGTVRMLSDTLAVWQGGFEVTLAGGAGSIRGYAVQVMKKVGDRWLILEGHPKLFPPPPPE